MDSCEIPRRVMYQMKSLGNRWTKQGTNLINSHTDSFEVFFFFFNYFLFSRFLCLIGKLSKMVSLTTEIDGKI